MFREIGRADITTTLQAVIYMQSIPAAELETMLMPSWNNMLKDLAALINKFWKQATGQTLPPGVAHQTAEAVFAAMLTRTRESVVDGKIELKAS